MPRKRLRLKKRIKNFLVFYCIVCVMFFASYTFSRYIDTTSGTSVIGIAKFNILVNDEDVVAGEPFNLVLSPYTNSYNNKLVPDSNGYFQIEINPKNTEVSLEYEFIFNLDDNNNHNIKLTKFTVNDTTEYAITNNNTVKGDLLLPSSGNGFTEADTLNIKVYWEWQEDQDIVNPNITDTTMTVQSLIKQKLS